MGKLTISMAIFNSFLYVYQRVSHCTVLHRLFQLCRWFSATIPRRKDVRNFERHDKKKNGIRVVKKGTKLDWMRNITRTSCGSCGFANRTRWYSAYLDRNWSFWNDKPEAEHPVFLDLISKITQEHLDFPTNIHLFGFGSSHMDFPHGSFIFQAN